MNDGPDGDIYCRTCYASKFGIKGYGFGQGAGTLMSVSNELSLVSVANLEKCTISIEKIAPFFRTVKILEMYELWPRLHLFYRKLKKNGGPSVFDVKGKRKTENDPR